MKEFSIEEKAKAYDLAIEAARCIYNNMKEGSNFSGMEDLEVIFPELSESEDEKIRKRIIHALHGDVLDIEETNKAIAWLEEQGKQKLQGKSALKAAKEEKIDNQNCVKPTYKNEPKFKVGDFIVNDYCMGKVIELTNDAYLLDTEQGIPFSYEYNVHLWTIKDAKPGDVLSYRDGQWIFIYKEIVTEDTFKYYALLSEKGITVNDDAFSSLLTSCVIPATREQCDLLFSKMKEAGYEWNSDKKELKKIENEIEIPFNAKDSELQEATYYIPKGFHAEIEGNSVVIKKNEQKSAWNEEDEEMLKVVIKSCEQCGNEYAYYWLKSIKDRVQPQPKQEWSEKDENKLSSVLFLLHEYKNYNFDNWLKSLRPQTTWKPSVFHLECISDAIAMYEERGINAIGLKEILDELKKLREE